MTEGGDDPVQRLTVGKNGGCEPLSRFMIRDYVAAGAVKDR